MKVTLWADAQVFPSERWLSDGEGFILSIQVFFFLPGKDPHFLFSGRFLWSLFPVVQVLRNSSGDLELATGTLFPK